MFCILFLERKYQWFMQNRNRGDQQDLSTIGHSGDKSSRKVRNAFLVVCSVPFQIQQQ